MNQVTISPEFEGIFAEIGFSPERIFGQEPRPWRTLADRENCVWDIAAAAQTLRLHVKRYRGRPAHRAARQEVAGIHLLEQHQIPTARLVAWGTLDDGRSFVATQDLAGFTPADKLIVDENAFDPLLAPTAVLAAKLHAANLHHRDLYLCHFMARIELPGKVDLRLIDAARVRKIPSLFHRRWIVKDLAEFWYSTTSLPITDAQRHAWLAHYAEESEYRDLMGLEQAVRKKSLTIAAHDRSLEHKEPKRNISIPAAL